MLSITRLQLLSTRVLETHLGGLKAACVGSALSKFRLSVGDGATYSRYSFGNGMTRVKTWEGVEYLVVTKVFCNIALLRHPANKMSKNANSASSGPNGLKIGQRGGFPRR